MANNLRSFAYCERTSDGERSPSKSDIESHTQCQNIENKDELENDTTMAKAIKYTPLELQFLDLKKEYSDTILLIECGYKYKIFGEDAQVAADVLSIASFMSHNFPVVSFPAHRLQVHIRRFVASGCKVGVVKQTESAALKAASENRNTLFDRKLEAIYTQSTFIEGHRDVASVCEDADKTTLHSGCLMCISETPKTNDTVSIGLVTVNVSAGEVCYSCFDDLKFRACLENCFSVANPVEFLLPTTALSDATETLIQNYVDVQALGGIKVRIERVEDDVFQLTRAIKNVSDFLREDCSSEDRVQESIKAVLDLPPLVVCCLSPLISYLMQFHLESLLKNYRHFQPLHQTMSMSFNSPAFRSLELFQNLSNFQEYGSLFWTVNFTRTKFGRNLLRAWIRQPLKDLSEITERQNAVKEILHSKSTLWAVMEKMLSKMPDLERLLSSAFFHRCTCFEFSLLMAALQEIRNTVTMALERVDAEIKSDHLKRIFHQIADLTWDIERITENINADAAEAEDKCGLFRDTSRYPKICRYREEMAFVEGNLDALRSEIAETLHLPSFEYATVMGQHYLIEVKNPFLRYVPDDWIKISSTKHVSRYQSAEIRGLCDELKQCSENLKASCNEGWHAFLDDFSKHFYKLQRIVRNLAILDCIFSFVKVARQKSYCRPSFSESPDAKVHIVRGSNPIVCKLIGERNQYVANDVNLGGSKLCMIITGPNMGGKSSYVRQIALISILAQAGSYVPAEYACLPIFDGIYVRMGAEDNLCLKRSTFMTEMEETSVILSSATSNSLVILDELGRGTSSHDGAAIAHSTLLHLIKEVRCKTLFVTHYPDVAYDLQARFPEAIMTCHLSFYTCDQEDQELSNADAVVFLYSVEEGIARKSYGINVARLAGIPPEILKRAQAKSLEIEERAKKDDICINI